MELTKETYEIWMIDYFDGNLSEEQVTELRTFLLIHPELDCDLEEDLGALNDESFVLKNKSTLHKSVNYTQFEDLSVSSIEGILSSEEDKEFKRVISSDVILDKHFKLFELTKFPEEKIEYKNKEQLKKTKSISFNFKRVIQVSSVAASILIAFLTFIPNEIETESKYIADSDKIEFKSESYTSPVEDFKLFELKRNEKVINTVKKKVIENNPIVTSEKPVRKSFRINKLSSPLIQRNIEGELTKAIAITETNFSDSNIKSSVIESVEQVFPNDWKKMSLIDKVAYTVNKIGEETQRNISLKTEKDNKGKVTDWALNIGNLAISQ